MDINGQHANVQDRGQKNNNIMRIKIYTGGGRKTIIGLGAGRDSGIKGIVQPFELGGVTRLIRSAVKFCMAGNEKNFF